MTQTEISRSAAAASCFSRIDETRHPAPRSLVSRVHLSPIVLGLVRRLLIATPAVVGLRHASQPRNAPDDQAIALLQWQIEMGADEMRGDGAIAVWHPGRKHRPASRPMARRMPPRPTATIATHRAR